MRSRSQPYRGGRILPSHALPATMRAARRADPDYGVSDEPNWRDVDWRAHQRWMTIDGRPVNYVDMGSGEPVVFVHGLASRWQDWLENLPRMARDHRVIGVDLPGFGHSPPSDEEVTIAGYARFLERFCAALDLGAIACVGNSMGGFIGAQLAIDEPDRVERLVLVDAAGISIRHLRRSPLITGLKLLGGRGWAVAKGHVGVARRPGLRHLRFGFVLRHPQRIAPDLLCEVGWGADDPAFADALTALVTYDFHARLGEVACPTLVVQGADDMLVPASDASEYEQLLPEARKVIMADTGHMPMIERPATFNDLVAEFLAARAAGTLTDRGAEPAPTTG